MNKLDGFEPVYVINLESKPDRRQYIEKILQKNNVTNYRLIKAIDGRTDDLSLFVHDPETINITKPEIASTASHLKAIETWLNESDSEYAIIIEDDLSFETVKYWDKSFKQFLTSIATVEYEIIQLAITNKLMNLEFHKHFIYDYSTVCYLITRKYAKKLILGHKEVDKYRIKKDRVLAVADSTVYNSSDNAYSVPLFTYSTRFESSINQSHVDTWHTISRDKVLNYWKNK